MKGEKGYFTTEEVAEKTGISKNTLYKYMNAGILKAAKVAAHWRIYENDLNEFLRKGTKQFRDTLLRDTEQAIKDMETYRGRLDDKFIDKEIERLNEIKRQLTE